MCIPSPGFIDLESGVWRLEWQVARWTGLTWDTLTATQQLGEAETAEVLHAGRLNITKHWLRQVVGSDFMIHPNRLKLGVRALNRAGLRSCAEPSCTTRHGCSCATSSFYAPWASDVGMEVYIDAAGPTCAQASAWLCDPSSPPGGTDSPAHGRPNGRCHDIALDRQGGAIGTAGGGFLSHTDQLRVQWDGFADSDSGIASCRLDVLHIDVPGRTQLGQRCICSMVMPAPTCDCASSPRAAGTAVCRVVTSELQVIARSQPESWRTSTWVRARREERPHLLPCSL